MQLKGITDEDFVNYKYPSMYICTNVCDFKCDRENGANCCQNSSLSNQASVCVADELIVERYIGNPITKAVVIAGLEPFDQHDEVLAFIKKLRVDYHCDDAIIIYTGYYKNEILSQISELQQFKNIIIKYGRYIPNHKRHFDEVLGVYLASDNQYAEYIS